MMGEVMPTPSLQRPSPAVAVITVSYQSESVLPTFLDSVPRAGSAITHVVVVDNLPRSDSSVQRSAVAAGAHYLPLTSNRGYGAAINAGEATLPLSVEWLLVCNPDVILADGAVDALLACGSSDASIGSVGPLIRNADGSVYPSAREIPSLRTGVGHALFANLWGDNPWTRAYRRDSEDLVSTRDAGWLSGACVLIRRSAFEQLHGFNEEFFMYFEDVDLGYRLGLAGYRNVYEPRAEVVHTGAHSTREESSKMIAVHHASAKLFLRNKYSGWLRWPVRVTLMIGLAIRSRIASARRR